jgi:predicted phosphoadenosine phosphosulfate sulfurtransferase
MKQRIQSYIAKWKKQGYPLDLPDEADPKLEAFGKAPSYRHICKAILRNDLALTSLGFSRPDTEAYGLLKRIELSARAERMNVFEAAKDRIRHIAKEFDNVYVSFSGGKDSGVLLNLAIDVFRAEFPGRKLGVFHIDYEAQYQMTTDYVDSELAKNRDILNIYRICLPIAAQCATSAHQSHWIPWDYEKKDLWVRQLPMNGITENNHHFKWFHKGMWDYELQERFASWLHEDTGAKRTACLVGIRTDESLNRWRAIHSDRNENKFQDTPWSREVSRDVYNFYPIFDWKVEDVWRANGKEGWEYNHLYDLFWKAGLKLNQMRVASPFNDCAIESLKLYRVIDPNNWAKMVGRVNGVNFAGIYGGTTAMGWRSIKLPKNHTWKTYMEFLLSTLPEETAKNYRAKLEFSQKFWREKGGVLSPEVIKKLRKRKIKIKVIKQTNYHTDKKPVRMEYLDDIDIEEFREIPTYKRMCVCIMKNDHLCKYMGFSLNKTETALRADAESKYERLSDEVKKSSI